MMITQWILSGLLSFAFLFSAFGKLSSQQMQVDTFNHLRLPQWFRFVTGIIQLAGVAMLIIGFTSQFYAHAGGLLLGVVMLGGAFFHIRVSDPFAKYAPAVVLALLNFALAYIAYLNVN